MSIADSDPPTRGDLARYAVAFAVGMLLSGFAAVTYWQYAYMTANPAVGSISTSTAGVIVYVIMFLAGATMVFNAVMLGLSEVLERSDGPSG